MAKKYVCNFRENGQVLSGTILEYPDEFTHEIPIEALGNEDRTFKIGDEIIIFDPIDLNLQALGSVGEEIAAVVVLPDDTLDSEVEFIVSYADEEGDQVSEPIIAPVVGGEATHTFVFEISGAYRVTAKSVHHGQISKDVIIHVPSEES